MLTDAKPTLTDAKPTLVDSNRKEQRAKKYLGLGACKRLTLGAKIITHATFIVRELIL